MTVYTNTLQVLQIWKQIQVRTEKITPDTKELQQFLFHS